MHIAVMCTFEDLVVGPGLRNCENRCIKDQAESTRIHAASLPLLGSLAASLMLQSPATANLPFGKIRGPSSLSDSR